MASTHTFRIPKARNTGLVELTMVVAIENERSRFNSAAGLRSQGFSDVCELPLAGPSTLHAVPSGS